jgi:hypothetical protein
MSLPGEYEMEMDVPTLIRHIFSAPCLPPFSFRFDLGGEQLRLLLSSFIVTGADIKFGKELAHLTREELGVLRDYMLSIGYDADYNLVQREKIVLDYTPSGRPFTKYVPYGEWQITFKIAEAPVGVRCV